MTVANGIKPEIGGSAISVLRRFAANVIGSFAVLLRPARILSRVPWLLPRQQLLIASGVVAALFLFSMVFVDAAAITAARSLPEWIKSPFSWATDFGKSGWFLWPFGILYLLLAALPRLTPMSQRVLVAVMVRVGFVFTAVAVPGLFTTVAKHIIGRARPFVGGGADPYLFVPFNWSAAYASVPSGHATTALSVLVALGSLWPRSRPILVIYALVILASRVVVTAHHPSDVLIGAVVGFAGALLVRHWFAARGLGFSIAPNGAIVGYPVPSLKRIKSVARELLG
ncbi:MAG: phosphatase PAP2 family protein [Pseudolabrys sp.]